MHLENGLNHFSSLKSDRYQNSDSPQGKWFYDLLNSTFLSPVLAWLSWAVRAMLWFLFLLLLLLSPVRAWFWCPHVLVVGLELLAPSPTYFLSAGLTDMRYTHVKMYLKLYHLQELLWKPHLHYIVSTWFPIKSTQHSSKSSPFLKCTSRKHSDWKFRGNLI